MEPDRVSLLHWCKEIIFNCKILLEATLKAPGSIKTVFDIITTLCSRVSTFNYNLSMKEFTLTKFCVRE